MNAAVAKIARGRGQTGPARVLVLALFVLFAMGCAGYKANLSLKAVAEAEALGKSAPVDVSAEDARRDPVVCENAGAMGMASTVTLAPGLEEQLRGAAARILAEKGFAAASGAPDTARKVSVRLEALSCANAFGGDETVAKASAALVVVADNNGHVSERRYEAETVWRLDGDNVEPDYDRLLSQTLSKALARLGADYDFLNDLAAVKLRSKDLQ